VEQFRAFAGRWFTDLFNQSDPFGRLSLVQVLMLAGDTLVAISLAGSLFFSISPEEAKGKVFLYLALTLAPFAIVSPLLGPLIDRTRGARRIMVVLSAVARCAICPFMAQDTHSLLLFPEAFLVLVFSKLYLVTRGALVPEMVAAGAGRGEPMSWVGRASRERVGRRGQEVAPVETELDGQDEEQRSADLQHDAPRPGIAASNSDAPGGDGADSDRPKVEYASINARLTFLGTVAGFVVSVPGIALLKLAGAPAVLVVTAFVFAGAAVAGLRLPIVRGIRKLGPIGRTEAPPQDGRRSAAPAPSVRPAARGTQPGPIAEARLQAPAQAREQARSAPWVERRDRDYKSLQPIAQPEVLLGLTTMSLIRGLAGFLVFLLAFGLRREHAALWWYGLALGASGVGALIGLTQVSRLRRVFSEQQILLGSIWLIALAAGGAAVWGTLLAQVMLAFVAGVAGSFAQPSFDAMTQRYVHAPLQGRAFARFATRQQLAWVLGAMIPVVVAFPMPAGDVVMAGVGAAGGLFYMTSRGAIRHRVAPRQGAPPG
jgi:hypothetical protein